MYGGKVIIHLHKIDIIILLLKSFNNIQVFNGLALELQFTLTVLALYYAIIRSNGSITSYPDPSETPSLCLISYQQHAYLIFKIKIYNIFHVQTFCERKRRVKKNGWSCLWIIFHIDIYISTMVKKCSTWLKSNWDNKCNIFLAIPFLFFFF